MFVFDDDGRTRKDEAGLANRSGVTETRVTDRAAEAADGDQVCLEDDSIDVRVHALTFRLKTLPILCAWYSGKWPHFFVPKNGIAIAQENPGARSMLVSGSFSGEVVRNIQDEAILLLWVQVLTGTVGLYVLAHFLRH